MDGRGMAWRTPSENNHDDDDDDDDVADDCDDDDDVSQESVISSWGFVQLFEVQVQGEIKRIQFIRKLF